MTTHRVDDDPPRPLAPNTGDGVQSCNLCGGRVTQYGEMVYKGVVPCEFYGWQVGDTIVNGGPMHAEGSR